MENDDAMTPELKRTIAVAQKVWAYVWSKLEVLFSYLRSLAGKAGKEGWRPTFCWSLAAIFACALFAAYYTLPMQHYVLPDHYYNALNAAFLIMLGALGLRTADKAIERHQNNQASE